MKLLILIFTWLLANTALAEVGDCEWEKDLLNNQHEGLLNRKTICDNLEKVTTEAELKNALEYFYWEARSIMDTETDRHKLNKKLNKCEPTKESKALVIAFEGTGAYEPLIPATMARFNKCLGGKVDPKLRDKIYSTMESLYKEKRGKERKWSGLNRGVMSELLTMKQSRSVDWYSFPSEESEILAGLDEAMDLKSWKGILGDAKKSIQSNPKGIQNARDCITQYLAKAKELKIKPKIVVTSHSSGGRSLVKFAEHMKKAGVDIDLAFSVDPVIEAHHAIEEVIPQLAGEPYRNKEYWAKKKSNETFGTNWALPEYSFSAVWTRDHKDKLYKASNVKVHKNFYQTQDRKGLDLGGDFGRFGIRGSQMHGADNKHIEFSSYNDGWGGHGSINSDSEVLKQFRESINALLKE